MGDWLVVCRCGHEENQHLYREPKICSIQNCSCIKLDYATPEQPVLSMIDQYKEQFKTIHDKMKWVLENWKWFRNYTNKDIVLFWWVYVNKWDPKKDRLTDKIYKSLDEPESITRSRRKWVQKDSDSFGPFIPNIEERKIMKQFALEEFMVEN